MESLTRSDPKTLLPVLQALADENRLRIVATLREGERCVCVLQDLVGLGQSLLSHHLRVLRDAGVVVDRKEGRWVHYSLAPSTLDELEGFLVELRDASPDAPGVTCCP